MEVCKRCVCLPHEINDMSVQRKKSDDEDGGVFPIRRWNFFIEQKWLDRINRDMGLYGFRTAASFIRYIIIKYFEEVDLKNTEKKAQTKRQ